MAANQGKGWFAILLGRHIDHTTVIPAYIRDALLFSRQGFTAELIFNIYSYRVKCALSSGTVPPAVANVAHQRLDDYRKGLMPLAALKLAMGLALPGDQIHAILATVQ
jgi:putative ATP-dependent endonuclease of OLD family